MEKRVATLVVTYNRLEDLKSCLKAIKNQTYKNYDVIVVNNGSTDGTTEYLNDQFDIICIHQGNFGGAGGFYTGMKYMFENGYDWLWMMDDDGLPEEHQLERLIEFGKKGYPVLNALVIDKDDLTRFSFGYKGKTVEDAKTSDFFESICPFNGTFIHRSVIAKCGYIKKEMFIWGDDQEYKLRMISRE